MTNFKEDYIYNLYKDNHVSSNKKFILEVKEKYNIDITGDVYRRIINYQIKKYGSKLEYGGVIEFTPKNKNRNRKHRQRDLENAQDINEYRNFLKRNGY